MNLIFLANGVKEEELKALESDNFEETLISHIECDYEYYYKGNVKVTITKLSPFWNINFIIDIEADTKTPTNFDKDFTFEESVEASIEGLTNIVSKKIMR